MTEDTGAFLGENDVKFIRLAFCDLFGRLKSISIMADEFENVAAFGKSFDASGIFGFVDTKGSDLILMPDLSTMALLPWRPQQGGRVARVYCDILYSSGEPFELDGRRILKSSVKRLFALGYTAKIALECEFYLFNLGDQGQPILAPHDQAGYLDFAPLDKGENVRREICLNLEQMGIRPSSSLHESGPGQNEIDLHRRSPIKMADAYVAFTNVAKTVASSFGLYASLLPKPLKEQSGSGLHVSIALEKDGENVIKGENGLTEVAQAFMQGILSRVAEISAFLNPLPGSYSRLGRFDAPGEIAWSNQNLAQLLRVPQAGGGSAHIELRSPDPAMNPYIGFALLLEAGAEGIERRLALEPEGEVLGSLPASLEEAVSLARRSDLVKKALPQRFAGPFLSHKLSEYERMFRSGDAESFEIENDFPVI
ncbi:MAG: glutamine synthetase family protein [Christensenellaceae bacterium]|jgi:glutamine synthetase|nr:glutamine synthetase family protein [Christensenellaceae bacterium]